MSMGLWIALRSFPRELISHHIKQQMAQPCVPDGIGALTRSLFLPGASPRKRIGSRYYATLPSRKGYNRIFVSSCWEMGRKPMHFASLWESLKLPNGLHLLARFLSA